MTDRARWWWGTAPSEIRGESTKQYSRQTLVFLVGRCSRISNSLRLQFGITREAARQIVKQCQTCPQFFSVPYYGVNPRGLLPNDIWQMDITHIPEFGKQKFVHVTIDTFSGFLHASLQSGEASKHCIAHYIKCFASFSGL